MFYLCSSLEYSDDFLYLPSLLQFCDVREPLFARIKFEVLATALASNFAHTVLVDKKFSRD